jgi:tagatose-1,6-bisphosphate aldolase non-catalytic subunit AgaZ/GatZ
VPSEFWMVALAASTVFVGMVGQWFASRAAKSNSGKTDFEVGKLLRDELREMMKEAQAECAKLELQLMRYRNCTNPSCPMKSKSNE